MHSNIVQAEIEEEKDKEVAELKAAVEDAEAINYTLAVGCKRMQSLLHPTSKIVAGMQSEARDQPMQQ